MNTIKRIRPSESRHPAVAALTAVAFFGPVLVNGLALAQIPPAPVPSPLVSLSSVPVPGPDLINPNILNEYLLDKQAAIRLGKALYWDTQVGSDGVTACATCHFHAGSDSRFKNQLSPGLKRVNADKTPNPDVTFDPTIASPATGPNFTLEDGDFPIVANDVVSSQGVPLRNFNAVVAESDVDDCTTVADPVFHVGGVNTRRVEPRNAPTVINAVFNFRNFMDGRANNDFNGVNPFGPRDPNARVWRVVNGTPEQQNVLIPLSSLASQAVGPPLSDFEMSCAGRTFPHLGRKMLSLKPLGKQKVHSDDSVLGPFAASRAHPSFKGLDDTVTYAGLIQQAFQPAFWNFAQMVPVNGEQFTLMEANFSLFFGLAIQLYESTLVSDDAPLDRFLQGITTALTPLQDEGRFIFQEKGLCIQCHEGGELNSAAVSHVIDERLERMFMGDGGCAIYDNGFYNIGVRPTLDDISLGANDPFGNPLSDTGMAMLDLFFDPVLQPPLGNVPECDARANVDGTFKTPTLRNIELTGPYFHNGGHLTLLDVVNFYNGGGDFGLGKPNGNDANLDPLILPLQFTVAEKTALVAFLKALTDERVRWERDPFDHPELCLPNGHLGDESGVVDDGDGKALDDNSRCIPAVGALGAAEPLKSFEEMVAAGQMPGTLTPTATDDAATTRENTPVEIDVIANDRDADGAVNPASVAPLAPPQHGTLAVDPATGIVTYTPHTDFSGPDSFAYTVQDNLGADSNEATVALNVFGPALLAIADPTAGSGIDLAGSWKNAAQRCRGSGAAMKCRFKGTYRVHNQGAGKVTKPKIRFFLSGDTFLDVDDIPVKETVIRRGIPAGKSKATTLTLKPAGGGSFSGMFVIALIDPDNAFAESDETNNVTVFGPIP